MRDILPLNMVVSRTSNMALSLTIKESRSRGCQLSIGALIGQLL